MTIINNNTKVGNYRNHEKVRVTENFELQNCTSTKLDYNYYPRGVRVTRYNTSETGGSISDLIT